MIAVIDTQAGNLFNINKIVNGEITRDPYVIERADKIVFPGVGSFSFVMNSIEGIKETIIEKSNQEYRIWEYAWAWRSFMIQVRRVPDQVYPF